MAVVMPSESLASSLAYFGCIVARGLAAYCCNFTICVYALLGSLRIINCGTSCTRVSGAVKIATGHFFDGAL